MQEEASCAEYILNIYITFLISYRFLKVHCRNIARKLVFLFLYISGKEREKALPCVSCIQLKLAFRKKKINVGDVHAIDVDLYERNMR